MKSTKSPAAISYPLLTLKAAAAACFALKKTVMFVGPVGCGKTQTVGQLASEMEAEMFNINLSTMEPTDVGGHPYPVEINGRRYLDWIAAERMMPFVRPDCEDMVSILFADEFDRSMPQTQNPAMTLFRERQLNGHKLFPSCAVCCAMNGQSDSHTTPISEAMATRCVFLYVQTSTPQALDSWDAWAEKNAVAPWLRGFARYRQNLVVGDEVKFPELQKATPRTVVDAWELMTFCEQVSWGREVIEPIVFGCVGQVTGREMIAFRRMFAGAPTAAQIAADPTSAPVPTEPWVIWALGRYLIDAAAGGNSGENVKYTGAFAVYASRWPEETRADWMRTASTKLPSLVGTRVFRDWESGFAGR